MATHTDEEFSEMQQRMERMEAQLAALQPANEPGAKKANVETVEAAPSAVGKQPATDVDEPAEVKERTVELTADAGVEELRKDSTMTHLMDALSAGKDIGHYGRLLFAMVARHFLSHDDVLAWLTRDKDFSDAKAEAMLQQVEERGYNPPKRDRILQWQKEQEFPILPNPNDPDAGNLYRSLQFPDTVYHHIEEYKEQRQEAGE